MLLCANLLQPCSPWSWWSQPEPPGAAVPGEVLGGRRQAENEKSPPKNTWDRSVPLSSPPCEPLLALRTPKHFFSPPSPFAQAQPSSSSHALRSWLFGARGMGFAPPGALTAWGEVKHTSPHEVQKKNLRKVLVLAEKCMKLTHCITDDTKIHIFFNRGGVQAHGFSFFFFFPNFSRLGWKHIF